MTEYRNIRKQLRLCLFIQAPFAEDNSSGIETLKQVRTNEKIMAIRDRKEADLVQVVGYFQDGYCGWG
ncbi:MAG: hypothetical protein ABJL67_13150 [Sulfitobacter sp.]